MSPSDSWIPPSPSPLESPTPPSYSPVLFPANQPLPYIRFMSHNAEGGSFRKLRLIRQEMEATGWTAALIQESWQAPDDEVRMRAAAGEKTLFLNPPDPNKGTHRGKGTYIMVDERWCTAVHLHQIFAPGYAHGIIISTSNSVDWIIVNIYMPADPPEDTDEIEMLVDFIQAVSIWIDANSHDRSRVVIAGDFNRVLDPLVDRSDGRPKPKDELFAAVIGPCDWIDLFRTHNLSSTAYTRKKGGHKNESRIDYIFSKDADWSEVIIVDTPNYKSAHRRVIATTTGTTMASHRRPPAIRRWFLGDETALEKFAILLAKSTVEPNCTATDLTNIIKGAADSTMHVVRTNTPSKDICENATTKRLKKEIADLTTIPLVGPNALPETQYRIFEKRNELERVRLRLLSCFFAERTKKAIEEPTNKQVFRMCNWQAPLSLLWNIVKMDGSRFPPEEFLEVVRSEFSTYFAERAIPHNAHLTFPTPNRDTISRTPMLSPVSPKFIRNLLAKMKDTAPGHDFITYSMWSKMSESMELAVTRIVNEAIMDGKWDAGLKIVHILPLPKIATPTTVKNRRPIGLLPTLLKVITSTVDRQLRAFNQTHKIISPEQQAYQAGCNTTNHGRVTKNLVEDAKRNKRVLWILSVDKENAYGTMNHAKSLDVLEKIGLPHDFIEFIRSLYHEFEAKVITGCGLTPPFRIRAGVIQGDPLSCLLYVIAASEPIIRRLKELNKKYKSRSLPNSPIVCITSYCDDDDLYANTFEDLVTIANTYVDTIDWLQYAINTGKTKIILICPPHMRKKLEEKILEIHGVRITILPAKEDTRALGFPICAHNKARAFLNQLLRITSINLLRLVPLKVPMTLFAIVLRAKIHSKLLYRSPINPFPHSWLKDLEKKQTAIIKRRFHLPKSIQTNILYMPARMGGLGFPSLVTNDTSIFIGHYLAALNAKNNMVRTTTRDRLLNEWGRDDHLEINPAKSDAHRFISYMSARGATIVHKPKANSPPALSATIWEPPLRERLASNLREYAGRDLRMLHHLIRTDGTIKSRDELEADHRIIISEGLYNGAKRNISQNGIHPLPDIADTWQSHVNRWQVVDWTSIVGERIDSLEPLEAWMDGSYQESSDSRPETAGLSFTIYRGNTIVKTLQMRVPGQQTIQRAEMLASILLLKSVDRTTELDIFPDSSHVISHATTWRHNPTNDPNAATNFDLVTILQEELEARDALHTSTTWTKVKSHSGIPRNDREDHLSNEARSLSPHPHFEWLLIPPDTFIIAENNTPIFDIKPWIEDWEHEKRLDGLRASASSWWYNIPNLDWRLANDTRRKRWRDNKASFLAQARTGALRVAALLHSWNTETTTYAESPDCPVCGEEQTITHIPLCSPNAFSSTAAKFNKIAPIFRNQRTRFKIVKDLDISPFSEANPVITIGHYGAIHRSVRTTLAAGGTKEANKTHVTLTNIIDEVTQITLHEWKFACDVGHGRDPRPHSLRPPPRPAAPILPMSPQPT